MTEDAEQKSASAKRVEAMIEEQKIIAEAIREKARLEQERFGWGPQ